MSAFQGRHTSPPTPEAERRQCVLDHFHTFPFSSDEAFQQGLSGILAHESTSQIPDNERSELILKTKIFYFNRVTGHNISLEDIHQARCTADLNRFHAQSGNEFRTSSGAEHGEMRTLTFAELKSLIEQGKTDDIPNCNIIPDTLNDGVPSESTVPLRRKPWEVANQS
ncbi:hypothetical protein HD554DRAFT_2171489 [Boletus coccyginus]|nr:hypothetical protein HD554DRAFT_2171489 [Boletus coccyginus]